MPWKFAFLFVLAAGGRLPPDSLPLLLPLPPPPERYPEAALAGERVGGWGVPGCEAAHGGTGVSRRAQHVHACEVEAPRGRLRCLGS